MLAFQINRNRFIIGCFATSKNRESELWEPINLLRHVITFNYFANQTSYYLAWSNHTCSITQQRIFLSKEFLANSYNTTATHKDDWSFWRSASLGQAMSVCKVQQIGVAQLPVYKGPHYRNWEYRIIFWGGIILVVWGPLIRGRGVNWGYLAGPYIGGSILRTLKDYPCIMTS